MDILYKCKCTKKERTVHVPDRISGTNLMYWMNVVEHCVSYDHQALSPLCVSFKMEYVKIPMPDENAEVGVPPVKQ